MSTIRRSLVPFRSLVALGALAMGFTVGCYTVDFDETLGDVYYCVSDSDCAASQACFEFRCVHDTGPRMLVTGPELLQNLAFDSDTLTANYTVENFTISDANAVVEGEGKVKVSVMGTDISVTSVIEAGAELDISSLEPGAHHLLVQAVYGDGTPYENPSASAYTVFFIEDENPLRPQVAIIWPPPDHVHIVGEPLEVTVGVRGFTLQDAGTDCRIEDGCDPWDPEATCLPMCPVVPAGHPHVYLLDDYPACLSASPTCYGDYVLSMRTAESSGGVSTAMIPGDRFTEAGTFTFSAALQYNDHLPYPNPQFIVYHQFTLTVQEHD
jgi:hypothetical protein